MISSVHANIFDFPLPPGSVVLDVRTPAEHAACALACAHILLPLDQVSAAVLKEKAQVSETTPVYVLCKAGVRARKAAELLEAEGFKNLHVIEGGLVACQQAGVPVATAA